MYVVSPGSNEGHSHIHWHVVLLPPGVRYEEEQSDAVMLESAGALDVPGKEEAALAERIAAGIRPSGAGRYEPPLPSPYSLANDVEQYRAYVNQAVVPESFAGSPGAARLDAMPRRSLDSSRAELA